MGEEHLEIYGAVGNLSLLIPSKIRSDEDKAMVKIPKVLVLSW